LLIWLITVGLKEKNSGTLYIHYVGGAISGNNKLKPKPYELLGKKLLNLMQSYLLTSYKSKKTRVHFPTVQLHKQNKATSATTSNLSRTLFRVETCCEIKVKKSKVLNLLVDIFATSLPE